MQVERENHIAFLSFDQLFKNTKLAKQREKETKNEGRRRVQGKQQGALSRLHKRIGGERKMWKKEEQERRA